MTRLAVQATKSSLLRLQEELDFARTGHGLLEEKREILLMRIRTLVDTLEKERHEMMERLAECYRSIARAALILGWRRLDAVCVQPEHELDVQVQHRSYMGLDLPQLTLGPIPPRPRYSPAGTNSLLDQARLEFIRFMPRMVECAQLEAQLRSLSTALRRTMKRVNALENVFIPDYDETVRWVAESLEEGDREDTFVRKRVKGGRR